MITRSSHVPAIPLIQGGGVHLMLRSFLKDQGCCFKGSKALSGPCV